MVPLAPWNALSWPRRIWPRHSISQWRTNPGVASEQPAQYEVSSCSRGPRAFRPAQRGVRKANALGGGSPFRQPLDRRTPRAHQQHRIRRQPWRGRSPRSTMSSARVSFPVDST